MILFSGLPGYGEFADVYRMKDILIDLVGNMFSMTDKIEKMQATIDYINQTFHETHEPMFKLEETLRNMTVSLGNLKQNLNTINKTLTDFKEFLRSFDDTVFNIDDVTKHIDDTMNHLSTAAKYVEFSVMNLNGTAGGVNDHLVDINATLSYVNKSAFDVTYTSAYSNDTLGSMQSILDSLEQAIRGLNTKVNAVMGGSDVISVSLKDINSAVVNTHEKLDRLYGRLKGFNKNMENVSLTVTKLNNTYFGINKTLEGMNEPSMFVNGTVFNVLTKLSDMDSKLAGLNSSMLELRVNMTGMNNSLSFAMDWLQGMNTTLNEFNIQRRNETITVSLQTKDIIHTIGVLIEMNGTLSSIGDDVEGTNIELDQIENKLDYLDESLNALARTLDNIDTAFKLLNSTITTVNATVNETAGSVDNMNEKVKQMNITIGEINISFENINQTLNIVNKTTSTMATTTSDVSEKLQHLNKTFVGLSHSAIEELKTSERLFATVSNFVGSSRNLNKQIHNANESLRILRGKSDIMEESNKILVSTMDNSQSVVNELLSKINETRDNLIQTSLQLRMANNSLDAMEATYKNMSNNLSRLLNSFENMNVSLVSVGPAIPTMMAMVEETKLSMDDLLRRASIAKHNLTKSVASRDLLVQRYATLDTILQDISETVNNVSNFASLIQDISKEAEYQMSKLKEDVNQTTSTYLETEKNILYINNTHDRLFELFRTLQDKRMITDMDVELLNRLLKDMQTTLTMESEVQNNYKNLKIPLDSVQSQLTKKIGSFQNLAADYDLWSSKFDGTAGLLWNKAGHPIGVYSSLDDLVNNTQYVNETLLHYAELLDNVLKQSESLISFETTTLELVDATKDIRLQIDSVNAKERMITDRLKKIENATFTSQHNVEALIAALEKKLYDIKSLREQFGNVNGTLENENIYDDMIQNISSEIFTLRDILRQLVETENTIQLTARQYKGAFRRYNETEFHINKESNDFLKYILSMANDTNTQLANVNATLIHLLKGLDAANKTLERIDVGIEGVETDLKYTKEKHDFVSSNRPTILEYYELMLNNVNVSSANYSHISDRIKRIRAMGRTIVSKRDELLAHNVNVNIDKELMAIDDLDSKLTSGSVETQTIGESLSSKYLQLKAIDESKHSLAELRERYKSYNETVITLSRTLEKYDFSANSIDEETQHIFDTFENILRMLSYARDTISDIDATRIILKSIERNMTELSNNLTETHSRLYSLDEKFSVMKMNYSNLIETEIDLSQSYINDALRENLVLMQNLTTEYGKVNITTEDTFELFQGLLGKMENITLDRYNIDQLLNAFIVPKLKTTSENAESIDLDVNNIRKRLNKLQWLVKDINDTVHISNKQLFQDKQKKILAETYFADLQNEQETLNQSLSDANSLLHTADKRVSDAMNIFNTLKNRLSQSPNVNISLDAILEKLLRHNKSLEALSDKLKKSRQELDNVNRTLWLDGEMYAHNETITDVQKRYKNVQELLNTLSDNMRLLEQDLNNTHTQTSNTVHEMEDISSSLDDLDQTDTHTDRMIDLLLQQVEEFDIKQLQVDEIILNMSMLETASHSVKNGFQHINRTTFNKHFEPFNTERLNGAAQLANLSKEMQLLSNNIKVAKDLKELYSMLSNVTIDTHGNLTQLTLKRNEVLRNLTQLTQMIARNLDTITNSSENLKLSMNSLKTVLSNITDTYKRTEKEEYFNSKFPGHEYKSYRGKLDELEQFLSEVEQMLQQVDGSFVKLQTDMNGTSYLQFNTSHLSDTLGYVNGSLGSSTEHLDMIEKLYRDTEKNLQALDGTLVSDNETLQSMKDRYKQLVTVMTKLDGEIGAITVTLKSERDSLVRTNSSVQEFIDIIEQFNHTNETLSKIQDRTNMAYHKIQTQMKENHVFGQHLNQSTTKYLQLTSTYNGTANQDIQDLKEKINMTIRTYTKEVNDIDVESGEAYETVTGLHQQLSEFQKQLLQKFTKRESLGRVLEYFPNLENTTNAVLYATNATLTTLSRKGKQLDQRQRELEQYITQLERLLISQEKLDYLNASQSSLEEWLQSLLNARNRTDEEIKHVRGYKNRFNKLLNKTYAIIINEELLNISLETLRGHGNDVENVLNQSTHEFESASSKLYALNTTIVNKSIDLFNLSNQLTNMKQSFNHAVDEAITINATYGTSGQRMQNIRKHDKTIEDLLNTERVVEMFIEMQRRLAESDYGLKLLRSNISETDDLFKEIRNRMTNNLDMVETLSTRFPNTSNTDIVNLFAKIRRILGDTVGLRLPLAENLVNRKLVDSYNVVKARFDEIASVLNQTHANITELDQILEQAENEIFNATMETENMNNDNTFFRTDAETNMALLEESDQLLRSLEELLTRQKKLNILNETLPTLKRDREQILADLQYKNNSVQTIHSRLQNTETFRGQIRNLSDELYSVEIPTNIQFQALKALLKNISVLPQNISHVNYSLEGMDIWRINVDDLVNNANISVKDVLKVIDEAETSMVSLNDEFTSIVRNIEQTVSTHFEIQEDLTLLNNTLNMFKEMKENLEGAKSIFNEILKLKSQSQQFLIYSNETLDMCIRQLDRLKDEHKESRYNTSIIEKNLNSTKDTLTYLFDIFNIASSNLTTANKSMHDLTKEMFTNVTSRVTLQDMLEQIEPRLIMTLGQLRNTNDSLHHVLDSIPAINVTIEGIDLDVSEMKTTLGIEKQKQKLKEVRLPEIEDKYQRLNITFEITNSTLVKMADEIEGIKNKVGDLRNRIETFETINMPTSDMSDNITHLENRLLIMQDNYNNVQDVLNTLRINIDKHAVVGRNVSLDDVQHQYSDFNSTIDLADEVLAKIEVESFEMANYFDVLNDTVSSMNSALDRFESKELKTKLVSANITSLGQKLDNATESLMELEHIFKDLGASFDEMQQRYKDVLNSTVGNNTIINDLLNKTGHTVNDIRAFIGGLKNRFNNNTLKFNKMNNTLFKNITTYMDLTDTLTDVKEAYSDISISMKFLEEGIDGANLNTSDMNPVITELSKMLKNLDRDLELEQLKHDFLHNNYAGLDKKLNDLKSPTDDTSRRIHDVSGRLRSALSALKSLSDQMSLFPNINITLNENFGALHQMNGNVSNLIKKLTDMNSSLSTLQADVSSLTDSNANVSEIKSRYRVLNSTIDSMIDEISMMDKLLAELNSNSSAISTNSKKFSGKLDKLKVLQEAALTSQRTIDNTTGDLENNGKVLTESELSANDIFNKLQTMKASFDNVTDTTLHQKLNGLLKKVKSSLTKLNLLQSTQSKFNRHASVVNGSIMQSIAQLLDQEITTVADLSILLLQSNTSLAAIANQTSILQNGSLDMEIELRELTETLLKLAKESDVLGESFKEEQAKQHFISNTLPAFINQLNDVEKRIVLSNQTLMRAIDGTNRTDTELTSLEKRMKSIDEINIPLIDEFNQLKDLRTSIGATLGKYHNASELHGRIDTELFKNKNLTFKDMQTLYNAYNAELANITDYLQHVQAMSEDIQLSNNYLKDTVRGINDTIDNFVEVNTKLEATKEKHRSLSGSLKMTNDTVSEMSADLKDLENTFNDIISTFTNVQAAENIRNSTHNVNALIDAAKKTLTDLKMTLSRLLSNTDKTDGDIAALNTTLLSTKTLLDQLKSHIGKVNASSDIINKEISKINTTHNDLNMSVENFSPALKEIMSKLLDLNDTYVREQSKRSYAAKTKPVIEKRFADLQDTLEKTNQRLSLTEVQLTDLRYLIKVQSEELDKLPQLDINTSPEELSWQQLSNQTSNVFAMFTNISNEYSDVQTVITSIDETTANISALKMHFENIDKTLQAIENKTQNINLQVDGVVRKINESENALNHIKETIKKLRYLQSLVDDTTLSLATSKLVSDNITNSFNSAKNTSTMLSSTLDIIQTVYSPLKNTTWEKKLKGLKGEIGMQNKNIQGVLSSFTKLTNRLGGAELAYNKALNILNSSHLTRANAAITIANLTVTFTNLNGTYSTTKPRLSDMQRHSTKEQKYISDLQITVNNLNTTLSKELQKFEFVQQHLPPTQNKYLTVNASYHGSLPDVETMKGQIQHLRSIIENIKEKMNLFGVPDSDNSVTNWDKLIQKLNSTIVTVAMNNEASASKLNELNAVLWNNGSKYRESESLQGLKIRFNGYNKTLDAMDTSAHALQIKLGNVRAQASEMAVVLMERDSILTTTPATTTPSGPPECK